MFFPQWLITRDFSIPKIETGYYSCHGCFFDKLPQVCQIYHDFIFRNLKRVTKKMSRIKIVKSSAEKSTCCKGSFGHRHFFSLSVSKGIVFSPPPSEKVKLLQLFGNTSEWMKIIFLSCAVFLPASKIGWFIVVQIFPGGKNNISRGNFLIGQLFCHVLQV